MKQDKCVFCQIGQEKNERKIKDRAKFYILLSANPQTLGHALVIPKNHYQGLTELSENLVRLLFDAAIQTGESYKKKLGAKAYTLKVNDNLYRLDSGGGHIGHIHIHVIPRYKKGEVKEAQPKKATSNELAAVKNELSF